MYDTKFECRYHREDVFLDSDDITDDEKLFIRDILYKEDLLSILNIDFDDYDDLFQNVISELYNKIKDYGPLKENMKKIAGLLLSDDEETGLTILYSYDYMHVTHKCISEYLETGKISEKNIKLLNEICK